MMKHLYLLLLACLCWNDGVLHAQTLLDNFNDGDFTNNPTWQGNTANFTVNGSNELQLNIPGVAATSYLAVPAAVQDSVQWEFYVRLNFAPSTTNLVRIYLQSNNPDLTAPLNGYYILIGETGSNDALKLFRQTNTTSTLLVTGTLGAVATNPNVRVRVTRNALGEWTLEADYTGGTNFVVDGTGTDNTHPAGSFFGFRCTNTTTNGTNFFFDDVRISPLFVDATPPNLVSVTPLSATTVDVLFNEALNAASAQTLGNYSIDNGINVTGAVLDGGNPALVHLTVSAMTSGTTYQLTASGVQDLAGNAMTAQSLNYTYWDIQTPVFGDILINEIMADPTPVVGLPNAEYVELFNRSNKTFNLANYVFNEGGAQTLPAHIFTPGSYVIITANANVPLFTSYGTVLGIASMSLTNGGELLRLFDNGGNLIDSVTYALSWYQNAVKADGGWSLELINPNLTCAWSANWIASVNPSGGTPGAVNSVFDNTPDTQAPVAVSASFSSSTQIIVQFNESVTAATAGNASNYSVAGFTVLSATPTSPTSVTLALDAAMSSGTTYTVNISGVADCSGNAAPTSVQFTYYLIEQPLFGEILINEIMADPDPVVGLPNAEYVELYNNSNKVFNLANYVFNEGSPRTLPNHIFLPGSRVILTAASNAPLFTSYGTVLGLSGMSLTNGGELLQLLDNNGDLLDSITYALSWYQNSTKANGGWSLELINPNLTCNWSANWIASNDPAGGTPGAVNSVFDNTPDTQAPVAVSATFTDNITVLIVFNEGVTDATASNPANYSIAGFTVTAAQKLSPVQVQLTLNAQMVSGTLYTVNITGVADCSSNAAPSSVQFTYYDIETPVWGDILINEIMADPDPAVGLPNAEYVELYNHSNKVFNLANYVFNEGSARLLPNHIFLPGEYVILTSAANAALFQSYGTVLGLSGMGLTNGGELLQLLDNNGELIDTVRYALSWYQNSAKANGGWSLELINPNLACQGAANWIASEAAAGGTPGSVNSVFDLTPDTQAPSVSGTGFWSDTEIVLTFNETLDALTASDAALYTVSGGFTVLSAAFYAPSTVVLLLDAPMQPETVYTVDINGVADCSGNALTAGIQFTYYFIEAAQWGDLIIHEILADPTPLVGLPDAEFIEIVNISNKTLDLNGYILFEGGNRTLGSLILRPNQFALLCAPSNAALFQVYTDKVLGVSSLSLNNSGEFLALYNADGELLDSVTYRLSWYNDSVKDDGGWSLEMVNPAHRCKGGENWKASVDINGGTPGAVNSVYDPTPDTQAPDITELRQETANQIYLRFNENMNVPSMLDPQNYALDGGLSVSSTLWLSNREALLFLSSAMVNNTIYTLTVNGAKDCVGNIMNLTRNFSYFLFQTANQYDIIINEIFPDYNPAVGLPEIEFVELYNRSSGVINLKDFTFHDNSSTFATLPFYQFQPGTYVVLHKDKGDAGYSVFGQAIALPVFPDLNVSTDDLVLRDPLGNVIDAVSYSSTWYGSTAKSEGGWTLERINPNAPCESSENWTASVHPIGGTPGQPNSVLQTTPDTRLPDVWAAYPFAADSVRLFFSEAMSASATPVLANYTINNGLSVIDAYIEPPFYNTIVIITNTPLAQGVTYTLTLQDGMTDCIGNPMSPSMRTVRFALPDPITPGDILINEVLFNPVTFGKDFVELYNHSDKVLNVGDLIFANMSDGFINKTERVQVGYLLFPGEYVVVTEEPSNIKQNYVCQNPLWFVKNRLPSYPDDTGNVVIYITQDTSAIFIDRFDYSKSMHSPLIDTKDGVSLERIDFDAPSNDRQNWHSGATGVGYATPTYLNSSHRSNTVGDDGIVMIPDNVFSPDGDGYDDFLIINYNVGDIGYVANAVIYDALGRPVRQLLNGYMLMAEGTIVWDGSMDNGKKAPVGMYIVFFEIYNPQGKVKRYKKNCTVAR